MTKSGPMTYHMFKLSLSNEIVKGYLDSFDKEHPTEESLIELICGLYEDDDLNVCLHCGSFRLDATDNVRKRKCSSCFKIRNVTAGTFFHGQKNIRAMCKLIELLNHGIMLSSPRIHDLVGIAQSSALQMTKKIMAVVEASYANETNLVSTGVFTNIFYRRTNETPAQRHPLSEQEAADEALSQKIYASDVRPDTEKNEKVTLDKLGPFAKNLYSEINSEPKNPDQLADKFPRKQIHEVSAMLSLLQLSGLVEVLPGDYFSRFDPKTSKNQNQQPHIKSENQKSFETIMTYIRKVSHGISRKHLPKFIASFWCFFDREKWANGELLKACIQAKHITDDEITATVTPPLIPMPQWCMRLPTLF